MRDWFTGALVTTEVRVRHVRVTWPCPQPGCRGEMVYTGTWWPTGDPGFHHQCSVCRFTTAIHGHKFPEIQVREDPA